MNQRTVLGAFRVKSEWLLTDAYKAIETFVRESPYISKDNLLFDLEAETDDFIRKVETALDPPRDPQKLDDLIAHSDPRLVFCMDQRVYAMVTLLLAVDLSQDWPLGGFQPQQPLEPVLIDGWRYFQDRTASGRQWNR